MSSSTTCCDRGRANRTQSPVTTGPSPGDVVPRGFGADIGPVATVGGEARGGEFQQRLDAVRAEGRQAVLGLDAGEMGAGRGVELAQPFAAHLLVGP